MRGIAPRGVRSIATAATWALASREGRDSSAASLADAVDLREYAVPTLDALPHDPLVAAVLPRPHSLPYGIVLGIDGAPYVCEFGSNAIARIDPNTLAIRELPLPDGVRPRRIALGADGAVYYTDDARGRLGRLDP